MIVTKFGGSSLADAKQFRKVRDILSLEPDRKIVIVSAPGKRSDGDKKVTDMLYACHERAVHWEDFAALFRDISRRYLDIAEGLGLKVDIAAALDEVRGEIPNKSAAYAASRGEYLNGLLLADYLGWEFADSAEFVEFGERGLRYRRTIGKIGEVLKGRERLVIPGFYGAKADGEIATFTRGGSDITGALVAAGIHADIYENWTDVSGFLMADPHIVPGAPTIQALTYKELRELSYMGASVLHDESVFPVRQAGIPTNIRNTNLPGDPGSTISASVPKEHRNDIITGIAGHKGFTIIAVEKALMNSEVGFGRKVLGVFEDLGICFEHMPSGIDTLSLVIHSSQLKGKLDTIKQKLAVAVDPDAIEIVEGIALIATVGRGMVSTPGTAARLFRALADADINVRMIDQGSSELNIIVGVAEKDMEDAVRAIYYAFAAIAIKQMGTRG